MSTAEGRSPCSADCPGDQGVVAPPQTYGAPRDVEPTVSVVVPAYQAAGTIATTLRSVLHQTRPALEIILVDDGSTDDLAAAIEEFQGRVVFIRQENRGVSSAMNAGAERASGEFIAWVGSDDYVSPGFIEEIQRAVMLRPDLDLLGVNGHLVRHGVVGEIFQPAVRPEFLTNPRLALISGNGLYVPATRRSVFVTSGGFDESLRCMEDWDLWLRIVLDGGSCGFMRAHTYFYRRDTSVLTRNVVALAEASVAILDKVLARSELSVEERLLANDRRARALGVARRLRRVDAALEMAAARKSGWRRAIARSAVARDTSLRARAGLLRRLVVPQRRSDLSGD